MKIVADENIPYVREVFSPLAEVVCAGGRAITAAMVANAQVLLVRSITQVDEALLGDSTVRFVGTTTIGTDHVDQDYLQRRGIAFADAAGSNANSVAEYVLTAILALAERQDWPLEGKRLGIIGVGNIGSLLARKAAALGLEVICNDPPRQRLEADGPFVSLAEALQADIITLHVPLTRGGSDPTWHLLDADRLAGLRGDQMLVNTSRGPVVDNQASKLRLQEGTLGPMVLDVWEDEPGIDLELLDRVAIGTAHIAGYSMDGKAAGTAMIHDALCRFLGRESGLDGHSLLPPPPVDRLELKTSGVSDQTVLMRAMLAIYDIMADDRRLRGLAHEAPDERGPYFDRLRKSYLSRRESFNTQVNMSPAQPALADKLQTLGFKIDAVPGKK